MITAARPNKRSFTRTSSLSRGVWDRPVREDRRSAQLQGCLSRRYPSLITPLPARVTESTRSGDYEATVAGVKY